MRPGHLFIFLLYVGRDTDVKFSSDEEDVKFTEPALDVMAQMGTHTSLRYALNLIAPSQLLAQRRKAPVVDVEDIRNAYKYFSDVERSSAYARETAALMFGEEEIEAPKAAAPPEAAPAPAPSAAAAAPAAAPVENGNGSAMDTSA